ncbi:MAG: M61 family metallopeptidase [Chitinophagaceae bacterium]
MKRHCPALFFLLIAHSLFAATVPKLAYTISPLTKGDYHTFLIEMNFKGSTTGKTTLSIPFETGLYRPQDHFAVINVTNSVGHQRVINDSSHYVIEHKPGVQLTLRYTIKNALKDSVPTLDEVYAQMLTDKYFYLLGSFLWVVPADSAATNYDISLQWTGFPAHWNFLNSYGVNKLSQRINIPVDDFQDAIYMGGDIRVHKLVINERPLYFSIRGKWNFSDEQVFTIIKRTVSSQRAYWNDYAVDRYTIALVPMKYSSDGERSINGRGLTNTFVTVGTNSKAFGLEDLVYLYNHELMHHWLGHVLKQAEPENAFKWFHEGFTDYFAHVVMLESGISDQQDFKKRINAIFSAYYSDSTHQWPNAKLEQDYWSSYDMQKLPYQRGLIFAFYLNESTRFYSKGKSSLKQVIQQMLVEARLNKRIFSQDWLLALLQKATGKDHTGLFKRFITDGSFISIADWELVSDKIALAPTPVFDLGFTTDKGAIAMDARINSIAAGANVQKAGLRVGDTLAGYSFTQQPSDTATIVVKRDGEKIKLRFLPSRQMEIPQLK